jgi:hypothetical protein
MSVGCADLARNPSRCPRNRTPRQGPRQVWACGQVLAGRPLSPADTAAAGGVRLAPELDTAAGSDVRCFRNRGRCPDGRVSTADTAACGCPLLQEAVAGQAAAGLVPPPPPGVGELALQPVAEPGAHVGHRRALQGQGLLGGQPAKPQAR